MWKLFIFIMTNIFILKNLFRIENLGMSSNQLTADIN